MQQSPIQETVGAGYFAALSEPLLAGREFQERDQRRQPDGSKAFPLPAVLPVMLNETAARGFFGNGNALGKRVRGDKQSYEVVGVVRNLKNGIGMSQSVMNLPLTPRDFARSPANGTPLDARRK